MANLKVTRVSDLPELTGIFKGMTTIIAYNKQNYLIDANEIKGKKIVDITGIESKEPGGSNTIMIKFDDGSVYNIIAYNGHTGAEGIQGGEGDKGNQGEDAVINMRLSDQYGNGITDVLYIVNNSETENPSLPWSAYRGVDLNEKIYELNETFMTEAEFERLFTDVKYIYAEFKTTVDDQASIIFNNDVSSHIVYKKYWTYEDSGLDIFYIYNPVSNIYESVSADLWKDVYLGNPEGFFPITTAMEKDDTVLYYYDKSDFTYKEVIKVDSITGIDEENSTEDNTVYLYDYLGNKRVENYYLDEVDAYINGDYATSNKKWTFTLVTGPKGEIIPEIYTSIDGYEFTKLTDEEVKNIDVNSFANYYYKTDDDDEPYKRIDNIGAYIAEKEVRYYKLDDDGTYYEVTSDDISEDNFDQYMIVRKNTITNVYTYERHYLKKVYGEDTYFVDTVEISKIDLYYYTDDRRYYTRSIVIVQEADEEHEAISEEVYTLVQIPSWIYAEFKTNDEDVLSLILNANDGLGDEDNTQVDNSSEDLNPTVELKSILRIVPGVKEDLYRKNPDGTYVLVNLNKDEIYSSSEYYILTKDYTYTEITGDYARSNGIVMLYTFNSTTNTYEQFSGQIINENIYYLQAPVYQRVENPLEYLSTENMTLFYGEPKALPINIYPNNSLRSIVLIEYDPEKLVFFEDGRIAATVGNNFETYIIIRSVENPNIYARVNIKLTTPVKTITLDESNVYETNIGESVIIKYSTGPDNAENKEIIWSTEDTDCVSIEEGEEPNTIKLTGLAKNTKAVITGNAADGYGAKISFNFEVIQVAEDVYWEQDNIIYHETVYYDPVEVISYNTTYAVEIANGEKEKIYTLDEIIKYNTDHAEEIEAGELERLDESKAVKEPDYYSMTVLLYKEVLLDPVVKPDNTSYPEIIWSSSDITTASVIEKEVEIVDQERVTHLATQQDIDNNLATELNEEVVDQERKTHKENKYYLTSRKTGDVVISGKLARYDNLILSVNVRINQSVEKIDVYPDNLSINVNVSKKLIAVITPDNDEVNKSIEWISSNSDILEVSPTGTITAKNPGNATVTVRALDGSDTFNVCNVVVTIPAKDIILSGEDINGIIYVGIDKTTTITAEIIYNTSYSNGSKLGINWAVADEEIASIDENGVVTGIKVGNTTVLANAKDGSGVFGTIKLQVIKLVESIAFDFTETSMELGDTLVLVPKVLPDDASNGVVIWQSSDESIAKVKQSGIVYALGEGECDITATTTDGTNLSAVCRITVTSITE